MKRSVEAVGRIPGPCWVVVALLEIERAELLSPVLEEAHARLTEGTSVAHALEVDCGSVERDRHTATVRVRWRDAAHPKAFPPMVGELQFAEAGEDATRICLVAEYEPPFGRLGSFGDALAGHRLARGMVRDAVRRLAEVIGAAVSRHVVPPPSPGIGT